MYRSNSLLCSDMMGLVKLETFLDMLYSRHIALSTIINIFSCNRRKVTVTIRFAHRLGKDCRINNVKWVIVVLDPLASALGNKYYCRRGAIAGDLIVTLSYILI